MNGRDRSVPQNNVKYRIVDGRSMSEGLRINKFISDSGVASRRAADRMVEEGRVTVNGRIATLGDRIGPGDRVEVDGKPISLETDRIIIAFNKPRGITCTADRDDPTNIIDFIGYPKRIYTIGRLDKDSEGLILLTNDGELANQVMRSRAEHEKEYVVTVDRKVTDSFLAQMSSGVQILGRMTKPCETERVSDKCFRIVLRQGLNRQIRRMCGNLGYTVVTLRRIRIMNVELGDLPVGKYRELSEDEAELLYDGIVS